MENIKEAHEHTMSVIETLKKKGIETTIIVPRIIRESDNPDELDAVKKYNRPDRLNYKLWRNVQFKVKDPNEAQLVTFARRYLSTHGCSFDTGAGCGGMDWEIDWSFTFSGMNENTKYRTDFDSIMEEFSLGTFPQSELNRLFNLK